MSLHDNSKPRAYAPDMDSSEMFGPAPASMRDADHWRDKGLVRYWCFSHQGSEVLVNDFRLNEFEKMMELLRALDDEHIHILKLTCNTPFLLFFSELREISDGLGFAPCILRDRDYKVITGLGRRLYVSSLGPNPEHAEESQDEDSVGEEYYDIWFTLPLADLYIGDDYIPVSDLNQELPSLSFSTRLGTGNLFGDMAFFYLSLNMQTRQARIIYSNTVPADDNLVRCCEGAAGLQIQDDPFTLLICALSSILQKQSWKTHLFSEAISKMEYYSNSLGFEITEDEVVKVKETAVQLRKFLPYMEINLEFIECMIQIITHAVNEHEDCRELLSIPAKVFFRAEKKLQTLLSQAMSFKRYQESRIRRISVCLSTLSSILSLRTDRAIQASTEATTKMTEASREDSGKMTDIAVATKLDSEAMITIAKLTMFYLPATFVATLFSMGIFNFDFENDKHGRLVISAQWWLYLVFVVPLTAGTFYGFRAVTRSHEQASEKAQRNRAQPE